MTEGRNVLASQCPSMPEDARLGSRLEAIQGELEQDQTKQKLQIEMDTSCDA